VVAPSEESLKASSGVIAPSDAKKFSKVETSLIEPSGDITLK